ISQGGGAPLTWKDLYATIKNCNIILDNLEDNDKISSDGQQQFGGEALFFRAYSYYHLTNLWGNVPYYRKNLPIEEIKTLGRTTKEKIRNEILEELQEAKNRLPDSYEGNKKGRISKWGAATFWVKELLCNEEWERAR